ncbi:MAG: hypothetical protein II411_03555 [Lachnospiraceae bacterium]|nr:hypothetical protein [Lachnospiraceae bacterium]
MASEKVVNEELEGLKKQLNTLKGKITTFEAKKKELEKEARELINKTIYEKRRDIERSFGEVLLEAEQRLKAAEKEKADERKRNIKRLVDENTKSTKESNIYLNNEIKQILTENKLPGFVNSQIYMSMWHAKNPKQILIAAVCFLVLLLVPTYICFVSKAESLKKTFELDFLRGIVILLIYFIFIFVYGLIWLLIDKKTKGNEEALNKIVEIRKNISDNKKEIAKISKETETNASDENFDYTSLDRNIENNKLEVEKYKKQKEDALKSFDEVTEKEIEARVMADANVAIKQIDKDITKMKKELTETQNKHDDLKIKLAIE